MRQLQAQHVPPQLLLLQYTPCLNAYFGSFLPLLPRVNDAAGASLSYGSCSPLLSGLAGSGSGGCTDLRVADNSIAATRARCGIGLWRRQRLASRALGVDGRRRQRLALGLSHVCCGLSRALVLHRSLGNELAQRPALRRALALAGAQRLAARLALARRHCAGRQRADVL